MNIAYSSSADYFKPTYVSIHSLLKNSCDNHRIHLLSSGVPESCKEDLKKMVESHGSHLEIIEIEKLLDQKARKYSFPIMRGNYSTYARIFLSELLPDLDDILVIDSDTLVLGEIIDIKPKKQEEKVIFACRDFVISNAFSRHEDPVLSGVEYWNMGVVYIDLYKWRLFDLTKHLDESIDRNYKPKIADQTIINRYLRKWIGPLPIKYNYYTYFHYEFEYDFYKKYNKHDVKFIEEEELVSARANPVVVHFIGTWYERPWFKNNISSFKIIYLEYWTDRFSVKELFRKPNLSLRNTCYDMLSIFIRGILGLKMYYIFRYRLIQAFKALR